MRFSLFPEHTCPACGGRFTRPASETRPEFRYAKVAVNVRCPACQEPLKLKTGRANPRLVLLHLGFYAYLALVIYFRLGDRVAETLQVSVAAGKLIALLPVLVLAALMVATAGNSGRFVSARDT